MSYDSPAAQVRRDLQRSLCNASGTTVSLRFVLGSTVPDAARGDVLVFSVPRNDRTLGTYLLTNRFFRYALTQTDATHIARADDDAAFDAGAISYLLTSVRMPWSTTQDLVFGPYGEWYMWNRPAMSPSCFAYYSFRWYMAQEAAREHAKNASSQPLARSQYECTAPDVIGPFPYAKGPFVAYSRSVAAAIAPRFDADEAVAFARERGPMLDVHGKEQVGAAPPSLPPSLPPFIPTGKSSPTLPSPFIPTASEEAEAPVAHHRVRRRLLRSAGLRSVSQSHTHSHQGACLSIFAPHVSDRAVHACMHTCGAEHAPSAVTTLHLSPFTCQAPFSEYVKQRPMRLQPALVYHKLKHPARFW